MCTSVAAAATLGPGKMLSAYSMRRSELNCLKSGGAWGVEKKSKLSLLF